MGADDTTFLDEIYATALDASGWESVIRRFADMVGGGSGFLSALDLVTGKGSVILSRCDPGVLAPYDQYYAAINPLNNVPDPDAFLRDWRLTIVTDEDKLPKDEYVRTEYYNDFVLPNDSHSAMMIRLGRYGSTPQVLNINRRRKHGSFDASDLEIAARYHPHFIRAFELGRKLAEQRTVDDDLAPLFSGSLHGLIVVTADAAVLHANPAAESMLGDWSGLRVRVGRLTSDRADARRALTCMIATAASADDNGRSGGSMAVAVAGARAPLSITVTPLSGPGHPVFRNACRALVCLTDPARAIPVPEARLRALFGLTGAEARVALALVDGGDLPTAAARLGIAVNTAAVHLARIYDKTGVNRQIALTNLILRCAGPGLTSSA
jgi:DNA-binding CsgD family transcriptional regulator